MSQGREGALAIWKEGQCVRSCSVPSTGFCRFALSDDQRHCFLGLDEKSKVARLRAYISTIKQQFVSFHIQFDDSETVQKTIIL